MSLFDEIINAAVEITGHVTKYAVVSQLVGQERGQALEQISNLVNGVTSEQLDWLEQQFLMYAQAQHSPDLLIHPTGGRNCTVPIVGICPVRRRWKRFWKALAHSSPIARRFCHLTASWWC